VARELGITCVVGTGNGTSRLHTGDVVRVDGSTGEIAVLAPWGG
jgi:pyruvate,water dikinase